MKNKEISGLEFHRRYFSKMQEALTCRLEIYENVQCIQCSEDIGIRNRLMIDAENDAVIAAIALSSCGNVATEKGWEIGSFIVMPGYDTESISLYLLKMILEITPPEVTHFFIIPIGHEIGLWKMLCGNLLQIMKRKPKTIRGPLFRVQRADIPKIISRFYFSNDECKIK